MYVGLRLVKSRSVDVRTGSRETLGQVVERGSVVVVVTDYP